MYYFQDPQNRERNVTRDLLHQHLSQVVSALEIESDGLCFCELNKSVYGAAGDVDLLFFCEAEGVPSLLIACEVKTIYLSPEGKITSPKTKKSDKQLKSLEKDGFDYVWLLEIIVTQPAASWIHPQAGDGILMETGSVTSSSYGYAKFQISGVSERLEVDAGSLGQLVVQKAKRLSQSPRREALLEHLKTHVKNLRREI